MLAALLLLATTAMLAAPDATLYDAVLKKYVHENGKVDYKGLKADLKPLTEYVQQIAAVSPDSHPALFPTRQARLAYWINAYNATVLRAFAVDYPERRRRLSGLAGRLAFFYKDQHRFG